MSLNAAVDVFWSRVWRCAHRHPCKHCCWPWRSVDLTWNAPDVWRHHASFVYTDGAAKRTTPAHRFAYESVHGPIPFTGHGFHFCHQCHFGPCCNYSHILPGAPSDNNRDAQRMQNAPRIIRLPDGRLWDFRQPDPAYAAFQEACVFQRIYAGPFPEKARKHLDHPRRYAWPAPPRRPGSALTPQDIAAIQYELRTLLSKYAISHDALSAIVALSPNLAPAPTPLRVHSAALPLGHVSLS